MFVFQMNSDDHTKGSRAMPNENLQYVDDMILILMLYVCICVAIAVVCWIVYVNCIMNSWWLSNNVRECVAESAAPGIEKVCFINLENVCVGVSNAVRVCAFHLLRENWWVWIYSSIYIWNGNRKSRNCPHGCCFLQVFHCNCCWLCCCHKL